MRGSTGARRVDIIAAANISMSDQPTAAPRLTTGDRATAAIGITAAERINTSLASVRRATKRLVIVAGLAAAAGCLYHEDVDGLAAADRAARSLAAAAVAAATVAAATADRAARSLAAAAITAAAAGLAAADRAARSLDVSVPAAAPDLLTVCRTHADVHELPRELRVEHDRVVVTPRHRRQLLRVADARDRTECLPRVGR